MEVIHSILFWFIAGLLMTVALGGNAFLIKRRWYSYWSAILIVVVLFLLTWLNIQNHYPETVGGQLKSSPGWPLPLYDEPNYDDLSWPFVVIDIGIWVVLLTASVIVAHALRIFAKKNKS